MYTHTDDDIDAALSLFLAVTLAVIRGRTLYAAVREHEDGLSFAGFEEIFRKLGLIPVDYLLNIDRSKSMSRTP
ncbi:hypothetical protein VB773_19810 [Haloarculaceae archaeon H-GB2-1]|nr:hypothetical protein [Haloarculaceae archaeon H-GB1-1]MEA5409601.1 hypothetical protein [Haloarculaceae archaeon H-GB2-1]